MEHHGQQGPQHRHAQQQRQAHSARSPPSPTNIGGSRLSRRAPRRRASPTERSIATAKQIGAGTGIKSPSGPCTRRVADQGCDPLDGLQATGSLVELTTHHRHHHRRYVLRSFQDGCCWSWFPTRNAIECSAGQGSDGKNRDNASTGKGSLVYPRSTDQLRLRPSVTACR